MTAAGKPNAFRESSRSIHPDDLLSKKDVLHHLTISSTTLYDGVKRGIYPAPVKIGLRRSAWRGGDILRLKELLFAGVLNEPGGAEKLRASFAKGQTDVSSTLDDGDRHGKQ